MHETDSFHSVVHSDLEIKTQFTPVIIRMLVTGLAGLEVWCQRMTETYPGVRISNMTEAWRDGLGFAAIIHRHRPDLIDFGSLKPGDIQR